VPDSQRGPHGPGRSAASRLAILHATARLFAERGYDHLTIEGIAAEAKVGKQTIYRWWDSKSALVAECLFEGFILATALTPPDSGDIRTDLTAWMAEVLAFLDDPAHASMLRSLMAAAADNEQIGRLLGEVLGAGSVLHDRLERAVQAGQLRRSTSLPEFGKALIGFAIFHALERTPSQPDLSRRLIDALLP
jgi:AcrR family transcriptional regulator